MEKRLSAPPSDDHCEPSQDSAASRSSATPAPNPPMTPHASPASLAKRDRKPAVSNAQQATEQTRDSIREEPTSSEMRFDWLADRWVIIAPQRTARPDDFDTPPVHIQDPALCPFCCGKEDKTPEAVASYSATGNEWDVRVVPNKFPAVSQPSQSSTASPAELAREDQKIDLFHRRGSQGAHEVIVESPLHQTSLTQLDRKTVALVFQAYADRLKHWLGTAATQYAVVFKNVGQDAGASLAHTHSQLIATDIVPTDIVRSVERMELFFQQEAECLFCRMVQDELDQNERIVEQTPDFIAFCPFASRIPSLINIMPKTHQSRFEEQNKYQLEQLSWLTHRMIRRLENCHPESSYNFVIHTAPGNLACEQSFHWRMELFPRVTKIAGFEWGSDCYINPQAPEDAASKLRRAGV